MDIGEQGFHQEPTGRLFNNFPDLASAHWALWILECRVALVDDHEDVFETICCHAERVENHYSGLELKAHWAFVGANGFFAG